MSPNAIITFPLFGDWLVLNLPRYFTIFGFNIYYYGLFITAGYTLAGLYLIKRRELFGLTKDNILDIILIAIPAGLVGARIYFMIFNYENFFAPGQWGNILRFRDGGLAVYGGIIASGLVFIIYSRVKKIPLGSLLDAAGFGLFIGQAVGRWGNFINREAYGVETDLPWKMGLTTAAGTTYVHPAFLYESLWNIAGLLIIHIFSKKSKSKYPGQYFLFYVAWYGLGRFMIEGLRTDSLMIPGTEIRASQLLAAFSCFTAVVIIFVNFLRGKEVEIVDSSTSDKDTETKDDEDNDNEDEINENEDDTDPENAEPEKEIAELDGASAEEIEEETKEEDKEDEETGSDPGDTEVTQDLADLDGASEEDIEGESEDDNNENEINEEEKD